MQGSPPVIAHVLTSLAIGGAERMVSALSCRQRERGYRVIVVSLENPPSGSLTQAFERCGVTVLTVPKQSGFDATLYARLYACFRREAVTVVHTHNPLPLIYAAPPARLAGARVVHTKHGPHPARRLPMLLRRIGAASTHVFVGVSEATAAYAGDLGEVASSKVRVILNATDLDKFHRNESARARTRELWNVEPEAFVIGTVGRLAPEKNYALLLRAAAPLLAEGSVLVITGDGTERASLEALAKELQVAERTRFLGEVHNVEDVMSGLDVFALSSHYEGLPMVLVEAMGASLPVVATAVGGVPKVVQDQKTGCLVPAGDQEAFERALRSVRDDRARAGQMGAIGCTIAHERYSLDRMVDDYFGVYAL